MAFCWSTHRYPYPHHRATAISRLILLLPRSRNILFFRSETGRKTGWAQARFFVAAGWFGRQTGLGRGVSRVNLEKIRAAAERVARSEGLEVVDVEWKVGKQRFLRVYIDRVPPRRAAETPTDTTTDPYQGISYADCERVSQQLSVILDVEELVNGPGYVLEVSSPGMDRALLKPEDFERFTGRMAKVWTHEPVEALTFFEGRIVRTDESNVGLELKGKTPRTIAVPYAAIRKANLVVEF